MITRQRFYALVEAIKNVRDAVDDTLALAVSALYPEWNPDGIEYKTGDRVLMNGTLFKCLQDHISQTNWDPVTAVSLWAQVLIPDPDVIPEWVQPESTNPYMTGDKVRHNNKIWVSNYDNNVWEPGVFGWSEITD